MIRGTYISILYLPILKKYEEMYKILTHYLLKNSFSFQLFRNSILNYELAEIETTPSLLTVNNVKIDFEIIE